MISYWSTHLKCHKVITSLCNFLQYICSHLNLGMFTRVILDSSPSSTIFPQSRQKLKQVINSSCTFTPLSEVGHLGVWRHQDGGGKMWAKMIWPLQVLFFLQVDKKLIKLSRIAARSILRLLLCTRWAVQEYDVIKVADSYSFCTQMTRLLGVQWA